MTPRNDHHRTVRLARLLCLRAGRFVALTRASGGIAHATGAAIYAAAEEILARADLDTGRNS